MIRILLCVPTTHQYGENISMLSKAPILSSRDGNLKQNLLCHHLPVTPLFYSGLRGWALPAHITESIAHLVRRNFIDKIPINSLKYIQKASVSGDAWNLEM